MLSLPIIIVMMVLTRMMMSLNWMQAVQVQTNQYPAGHQHRDNNISSQSKEANIFLMSDDGIVAKTNVQYTSAQSLRDCPHSLIRPRPVSCCHSSLVQLNTKRPYLLIDTD